MEGIDTGIKPISMGFQQQGCARLYVYSPKFYDDKFLRPYTYNVTENALDKLIGGGDTMTKALSRKDIALSKDIAGCIKPETNGIEMDMSVMSNLWTFMLEIDLESPWLSGSAISAAKAKRRIVYSGVCLEEPVAELTLWSGSPVPNENCPLRFTHATEMIIDPAVSAVGAVPRAVVRSDCDIVDSAMNMQANGKDLFIATPDKMLKNVDAAAGFNTEGLAALTNTKKGVGIVSTLKSPLSHLRQLCMGLDQQVALNEASGGSNSIASAMGDVSDIYDLDSFKQGVAGEWSQLSAGCGTSAGGIDSGDIILLGYLARIFPNLTIIPQRIAFKTQLDVLGQGEMNPKVVYSSMVASAVSAIANNFGFSSIDFSYDSFVRQWDSNAEGSFEVRSAYLLLPPSDQTAAEEMLKHGLEMFRRQLCVDLFPALKAADCGDFQLNVSYSINSETYVDLNFYDYASLAGGFYETPNRIANLGSTSIGTAEHFTHNGAMLDTLVHNVYGRNMKNAFGTTAFGGQDAGNLMDTCAPGAGGGVGFAW